MSELHVYPVRPEVAAAAHCDSAKYQEMYEKSVKDPEGFWEAQGRRIDWIRPYSKVKDVSFARDDLHIRWFYDGSLNASANCLDRHLESRGDQTAIIWEGDDPADDRHITYRQLYEEVCQFANGLKSRGIGKGDMVTIYMPMIPEAAVAMLACARIGAPHSVVFGGFSPDALGGRIKGCDAKVVITADEGLRGGRKVPLKKNVDTALSDNDLPSVETVVVVRRTGGDVAWEDGRDVWYHELTGDQATECPVEEMDAEDPLFILYTSGSTGQPKGVLHTTGGYMVYAAMTHEYVFDYRDGEIYWCTADVGWITGHSYIVYGPLANGATTLMFEGVPNYPDFSRFWQVVDKHKVSIFYTAPTAIRALMREGEDPVTSTDRSSLRLLGTVGEPINPEAWEWYYRVVGDQRCPIVDTWWQTETGGILITPLPGATDLKPGSATRPFFGVEPAIVDGEGQILDGATEGNLVLLDSWPGQMRTVFGDHERFVLTYFSTFDGMYFTGDGARRDEDGYYWITGRVDDVLNVSGHRMGTAEIESALVAHKKVAEAAVVGYPHDIKGQGVYVYVTLLQGEEPSDDLLKELRVWVRKEIGPIATPDIIQFTPALPKTRSGKIMRRILRKVAANEYGSLGDTSTLADPGVVDDLIEKRKTLD
ncbi:MAG: acetate--CoA ligase [Chromatiales bacterium]|jgi:acetyl-CoA synthetase|nr:acetate--CoA ligase [Chromatiales bacterium]